MDTAASGQQADQTAPSDETPFDVNDYPGPMMWGGRMSKDVVRRWQTQLSKYYQLNVDGIYGKRTLDCVHDRQTRFPNARQPTHICGEFTWHSLVRNVYSDEESGELIDPATLPPAPDEFLLGGAGDASGGQAES